MYVDVSSDSYDSLYNSWSNMGGIGKSRVADAYAAAAGGSAPSSRKRSEIDQLPMPLTPYEITQIKAQEARRVAQFSSKVKAPRSTATGPKMKRVTPHAGRSRRTWNLHAASH